jgi:hypothetical protein
MNSLRLAAATARHAASSLAAMNPARSALASSIGFIFLAGCGPAANTPVAASPPIAARPDVIVTLDGQRHACVVALYSEAQGSAISCDEVVPFVRDELRVPSGAIYDIRTISDVDEAEIAKVEASFKGAGYRFIGGPHALSTTGSHKVQ